METDIEDLNKTEEPNTIFYLEQLIKISTTREERKIQLRNIQLDYDILTESRKRLLNILARHYIDKFDNIITYSRNGEKWNAEWNGHKIINQDTKVRVFYNLLGDLLVKELEKLIKML